MTTLGVVVPTHDTRELTLRCLASLTRLETDAAVMVVDDGSSDGTAAAIRERFPAVGVLRHDTPKGFTAAANAGLAAAPGELLLLLNSDTEVEGGWAAAVRAFDAEPHLGVAGARLLYPDGRRQWSGGRAPTPAWLFAQASGAAAAMARVPGWRRLKAEGGNGGRGVDWVPAAAMCLRRETWQEIGPFDPRFDLYCQDTDLCLRAAAAGWQVALLEELRVVHLLGGTITAGAGRRRYDPARMWPDLVRLAAVHGDPRAARRALVLGARCRLLARRLLRPTVAAAEREGWDRDTTAYRAGLEALLNLGGS